MTLYRWLSRMMLAVFLSTSTLGPAMAQTAPAGRVTKSSAGRAGEREAREQDLPGIASTSRIPDRLQNRIHNRLQNRIDRNYAPQADAAMPYTQAEDRVRTSDRSSSKGTRRPLRR